MQNNGTYVKDMKDSIKVCLPSGDRFLVALRTEKSRGHTPPALLDDIPPDFYHSSAIEN